MRLKLLGLAAMSAALSFGAAANAETYTLKDAQLSDGTKVSGAFSTNLSGYIGSYDISTVDGAITGYHYNNQINVAYTPGGTSISFSRPDYVGYLTLVFAHPLGAGGVPLLTGVGGPSLECNTYGCSSASANDRYLIAGVLAVPEPGSWAMMLTGLGAIAAALRQRRRPGLSAAA